jgi:hypothetical protein
MALAVRVPQGDIHILEPCSTKWPVFYRCQRNPGGTTSSIRAEALKMSRRGKPTRKTVVASFILKLKISEEEVHPADVDSAA